LTEGVPFYEILQVAKRLRCDLIVLATHGRTGLVHAIMGSVAENVVRRARCPVLTIHPPRFRRGFWERTPHSISLARFAKIQLGVSMLPPIHGGDGKPRFGLGPRTHRDGPAVGHGEAHQRFSC